MPITRMSHEVIFIPTLHPNEWIYLSKDYETLKKVEPASNEIQTHSLLTKYECHPRKFQIYSLADCFPFMDHLPQMHHSARSF